MKLVTPPLAIEITDGFQNDRLNRQEYGEALLNLVSNSTEALVISLDGKWGEGKTTFVKMWQGLLNRESIPNLYIDAFTNDHIDDAFISIASAITTYAEENIKKGKEEKIEELINKSKKVGSKMLSWSTRVAVKAITLGIIKDSDIDAIEKIKDEISESASDIIGDYVEERITAHAKDIELIESFKELLSSLPSKLTTDDGKPLVIIIDELDRCKPTFAVEILEKIKHLFSVKNIIFLLVINKEQLEESIKCIYGHNIDAHTYLQKFINLEFRLPKQSVNINSTDYAKYIDRLLEAHEIETWGDSRIIRKILEPLAIHLDLSLRQLEKVFTNIALFYASSSERSLRIVQIITTVCVIKVYNPDLFSSILKGKCSIDSLYSGLKIPNSERIELSFGSPSKLSEVMSKLFHIISWMEFGLMSESEYSALPAEHPIAKIERSLYNYSYDRESLVINVAHRLSMFYTR